MQYVTSVDTERQTQLSAIGCLQYSDTVYLSPPVHLFARLSVRSVISKVLNGFAENFVPEEIHKTLYNI